MVVPQYGSTAHGRAVVRQHGVRQCGGTAVRQNVYCERHMAILVHGSKREVYGIAYDVRQHGIQRMTNGSTAYGGAQGGWANWAYGIRHTAYGMVYSARHAARGAGIRHSPAGDPVHSINPR